MSPEEKSALLARSYACAICGCGRSGEKLVIDHDHVSDLVRGVVCERCNHLPTLTKGSSTTIRDKWWTWIIGSGHDRNEPVAGKFLFFSADRDRLLEIARAEVETGLFPRAKVRSKQARIGSDYVLCLLAKNRKRAKYLATKYPDSDGVKFRFWKSEADTLAGVYSDQYWEDKAAS